MKTLNNSLITHIMYSLGCYVDIGFPIYCQFLRTDNKMKQYVIHSNLVMGEA